MTRPAPPARVVLLAGPSGSGKSYVARRSGLPVLALDDFSTSPTFRRLARDLREARKAPRVLVRRGWALLRAEPAVLARQTALGCTPRSAADTLRAIRRVGG